LSGNDCDESQSEPDLAHASSSGRRSGKPNVRNKNGSGYEADPKLPEFLIKVPKQRKIVPETTRRYRVGAASGAFFGTRSLALAIVNHSDRGRRMLSASRSVIFEEFRFIVPTRELLRIGDDGSSTPIALGSRAAEILLLLLQRRGELVSKNEIMDAVWPHMAIEDSNLTVQMSALRRALDDGRDGGSLIQTVPGRGYRFTAPIVGDDPVEAGRSVTDAPAAAGAGASPDAHHPSAQSVAAVSSPAAVGGRGSGNRRLYGAGAVGLFCAALVGFAWQGFRAEPPTQRAEPPRLSIVVLPFANAGGAPKDEELAAALTDDFTTDLAQMRGASVVARSMAQAIAGRKLPLPKVGSELAVRYALEGSIRRASEGIELNLQLSEAASGTSIWTTQFKGAANEPGDLRLRIAQSLLAPLRTAFMDAEARRISSLPDATLTADDLLLKVDALNNHLPVTPAKNAESMALLERALALDPLSAEVMISLANQILRPLFEFNDRKAIDERLLRARTLADRARTRAAGSEAMLALQAQILRAEGRFDEALAAYAALMRSSGRFRGAVARCLIALGRSAEAVPLLEEAIRLDRDASALYTRYNALGLALIRIGRYEEAIGWLRAANEASSGSSPQISWNLTVAYAHAGKIADARRELVAFRKRMGGLPTARRMRHVVWTLRSGGATPGYCRGARSRGRRARHRGPARPRRGGRRSRIADDRRGAVGQPGGPDDADRRARSLDDRDGRTSGADRRRRGQRERNAAAPAFDRLQRLPGHRNCGHQFCSERVSERGAGRCETSSPQALGRRVAARKSDPTRDNLRLERWLVEFPKSCDRACRSRLPERLMVSRRAGGVGRRRPAGHKAEIAGVDQRPPHRRPSRVAAEVLLHRLEVAVLPSTVAIAGVAVRHVGVMHRDLGAARNRLEQHLDPGVRIGRGELGRAP